MSRGARLDIQIVARDLSKLHRDLKIAGSDTRKVLRRQVGATAKPLAAKVKANASADGLVKASKAVRIRQTYGSRGATVRIRVDRKRAPYAADGVSFRHPVFGNRNNWVSQPTEHGFFDRAVEGTRAVVDATMVKVLTDIIKELT